MNILLKITLFAFLLIFTNSAFIFAQNNIQKSKSESDVNLTPEERAWLKEHPNIVLGYTDSFEPEVIVNPDGSLRGILVDLLAELNQRLGTRIDLKIYPVPELIEKMQNKEVDGIMSLHPGYADKLKLLKTRAHSINYPALFARKDMTFDSPSDLTGKRIAIIDKVFFSEQILEQYSEGATILKVRSAEEGMLLTYNGEADFFLGASLNTYLITKYQLFDLVTKYIFFNEPIKGIIGTRSDWPELSVILDKGLSRFSQEELEDRMAQWIHLDDTYKFPVELTQKEKSWLDLNHQVRVRVGNYPNTMFIKGGKPYGIVIDLLNIISERTSIKFDFIIPADPFAKDLEGLIQHTGPDLLPSIQISPERVKHILFTEPYQITPRFIFTHIDSPFVSSMDDLTGKTVAVENGFLVQGWISKRYPEINLLACETTKDALTALSANKAFAYIGPLRDTGTMLIQFGLTNIKATAPSALPDGKTSMGIRSDWPELQSIINKVLASMTREEKNTIINKWSSVRFEHGITSADVRKWVVIGTSVALSIMILFLLWNWSLRKTVEAHTSHLTESEARFRGTFEQAAVGIAHVSPEGHFLRINQKFCDIVGYSGEEMLEHTFQDITHPEDLDRDLGYAELLIKGQKANYSIEKRYFHKNGGIVWVNLTVSLLRTTEGDPKYFISVVEDISDRKKVEEERDRILNLSQDLICVAGVNGYFKYLNPAWEKILGYSNKELYAKPFLDFIHPDDHNKINVELENLRSGTITLNFENRYIHKDDSIRYIDWTAVPIHEENIIYCIGRDITEKKKAEINILQSEERYRTLFEGSQNGIIFADVRTRKFKYANSGAARMLGYTQQELCTMGIDDIHPVEALQSVHTEFESQIKGESNLACQLPCLKKDGTIIYVNLSANHLSTSEGNFSVGFYADVTAEKRIEDALKQREKDYRNLMKQAPISIQIHDREGKLVESNPAYTTLYALSEETLDALYEKYNVLEDDQAGRLGLMPYIKKVFAGEESKFPIYEYNGVDTLKTLDFNKPVSRKCWVRTRGFPVKDESGNVTRAVFISEDITEQKQAEETIKENEVKFKGIVSSISDPMSMMDKDLNIVWTNNIALDLFGTDILEQKCYWCYKRKDIPCEVCSARRTFQDGKVHSHISNFVDKDGNKKIFWCTSSVADYDEQGNPSLVIEFSRDITEQKEAEKALDEYQQRLQALAAQLTLSEEKERRRIATDLHDQIGQLLASSRFQLVAMINKIDDPVLSEKLENVSGNLRQAVDDTRHIISDLSSPLLQELGFEAAISEWLEENVQNRFDIKTSFSSNTNQIELEEDVSIMLYRSIRELLTNVIKHAQAKKVDVIVEALDDILKLIISDDGIGFKYDSQVYSQKGIGGLGLFSIRERMSDLGGEMIVKSSKSQGTKITLTVPLRKNQTG